MELEDVKTAEKPINSPAKSPLADDLKLLEKKKGTRKQVKSGKSTPKSRTPNSGKDEKSNSVDPLQATAVTSKTEDVETAQVQLRTDGAETASSLPTSVDSRSSTEKSEKLGMGSSTTTIPSAVNTESYGSAKTNGCQTAALTACTPQATTDRQVRTIETSKSEATHSKTPYTNESKKSSSHSPKLDEEPTTSEQGDKKKKKKPKTRARSNEKKQFKKSPIGTLFKKHRIRRQKSEEKNGLKGLTLKEFEKDETRIMKSPSNEAKTTKVEEGTETPKITKIQRTSTATDDEVAMGFGSNQETVVKVDSTPDGAVDIQPTLKGDISHKPRRRSKSSDRRRAASESAGRVQISKGLTLLIPLFIRSLQTIRIEPKTNEIVITTNVVLHSSRLSLHERRKELRNLVKVKAAVVNGKTMNDDGFREEQTAQNVLIGKHMIVVERKTILLRSEQGRVLRTNDTRKYNHICEARMGPTLETDAESVSGVLNIIAENGTSMEHEVYHKTERIIFNVSGIECPPSADNTLPIRCEKSTSHRDNVRFEERIFADKDRLIIDRDTIVDARNGTLWESPQIFYAEERRSYDYQHTLPDGSLVWTNAIAPLRKDMMQSEKSETDEFTANEPDSKFLRQTAESVTSVPSLSEQKPVRKKQEFLITSKQSEPTTEEKQTLKCPRERDPKVAKNEISSTAKEESQTIARETQPPTALEKTPFTAKEPLSGTLREEPPVAAKETDLTTGCEEAQGVAKAPLQDTAREEHPTTAKKVNPTATCEEAAHTVMEPLTRRTKEDPPTIAREMETTTLWEKTQYAPREPLQETAREELPATAKEIGPSTASEEADAIAMESLIEREKEQPHSIASETEPTCEHEGTICAPEESLRQTANEEHPATDKIEKQTSWEEPVDSISSLSQLESVTSTDAKPEDEAQKQNENEQPQLIVSTEVPLQKAEQHYRFAVPMVVLADINGRTYKLTTHYNVTTDRSQLIFNPLSIKFDGRLLWEKTASAEVSETPDPVASYTIPQEDTRDLSVIGDSNSN